MTFSIIEFFMAASPTILIFATLCVGWKVLWKLFDDLLEGGNN